MTAAGINLKQLTLFSHDKGEHIIVDKPTPEIQTVYGAWH
jgi:hypothetical protein